MATATLKLKATLIFAKDIDRMRAFYQHGMGLELLDQPSTEWAAFDAGGVSLALHAIPAEIAPNIQITTPPKARTDGPIKPIFQTDDVAAARAHLQAHGAVMFEPRGDASCDGLDPEGNVFQIVQR
jgi:catechol 2,3-dioxygenase-like lactoylglutathione lyase family enzyme